MEKIEYCRQNDEYRIKTGLRAYVGRIGFRSVYFCVFPETKLEDLRKYIRVAAMAKYTHIVLEFWGMLKFDFMKELAWDNAYTKEEIRPLIDEANMLGMEVIPMFNHLGHASSSRMILGKHVVLDQNPKLEYLFKMNGWVWDYENEEVLTILRNIRKELIQLCGVGEYFHIGCDEAFWKGEDDIFCGIIKHINDIKKELEAEGRKTIMWGDMMLYEGNERFRGMDACKAITENAAKIVMENIDKDIIIADWHYGVDTSDWSTSQMFKENGFDVICAPYDWRPNAKAAMETVEKQEQFGIMHTTWNTLVTGFPTMVYVGIKSFIGTEEILTEHQDDTYTYAAMLIRKVCPSNGDYLKSGWSEYQINTVPGI